MADELTLAEFLQQPSTANVLAGMPEPSWHDKYVKPWGSASLAQQEPNWFGRNVLGGAAKISESLPLGVGDIIMAGLLGPRAAVRIPNPTRPLSVPEGFDTARTWYHGAIDPFETFDFSRTGQNYFAKPQPNGPAYFTSDKARAQMFADTAAKLKGRGEPHVKEAYLRNPEMDTSGDAMIRNAADIWFLPRIPNPIKAYHGSPHDFDKFDLSKIGTGEGAQAYGHGLYFAEKPEVAAEYRRRLSPEPDVATSAVERRADKLISDIWQNASGDGNRLREALSSIRSTARDPIERRVAEIALARAKEFGGHTYEVALHATPEQFLDWDKHVSGQPIASKLVQAGFSPESIHPESFYDRKTGGDFFRSINNKTAPLQQAGIPGIRYHDQGSRGRPVPRQTPELTAIEQQMDAMWSAAERQGADAIRRMQAAPEWKALEVQKAIALDNATGTHNYVVWSPEIIEILRKYGILAPVAAPTLANVLAGDRGEQ